MTERKQPIGIQSSHNLRENDFIYIDKTQYIAQLLNGKVYFLSRPRRFGKSLFLPRLPPIFVAQKSSLGGVYLEKTEEELARQEKREAWQQYPVLYLDLNVKNYTSVESLLQILDRQLLVAKVSPLATLELCTFVLVLNVPSSTFLDGSRRHKHLTTPERREAFSSLLFWGFFIG